MPRVVVTGGAGFIGSHLAQRLSRDYEVAIIDDLSTGRQANIAGLVGSGSIRFVQGSINDDPLLRQVCHGAEYVFHQAALPSVPRSIADPLGTATVNIEGTLKVLLAARDCGVKKVVFASSSSVYGRSETLPLREDQPPNPLSPYALTKLTAESYCHLFHRLYGLPTACLRYFNVYGPRQNPHSQYAAVIPSIVSRLAKGEHPIITGDGEQTRDFTFVGDVVEANVLAAQSDECGAFNVGTGRTSSINQLARLIMEVMGRRVESIHVEARIGEARHTRADISRARSIGYSPKYDLEAGLRLAVPHILSEVSGDLAAKA